MKQIDYNKNENSRHLSMNSQQSFPSFMQKQISEIGNIYG